MKILFVSGELIGSAICQKLHREGNEIKLYIHKSDWKNCLDGIIPKVKNWRKELDWVGKDGLIVFDDVIFGHEQDELRKLGYRVVGGTELADKLENERNHFCEILNKYDIKTLPSYDFHYADEAIRFVKKNPGRWVVKQNSHVSSLNYIGKYPKSTRDVVKVLQEYKRRLISPVHIQKHVSGIEVGVARYFNGNDWVGPIEINHEHKKMHEGDNGPLTPEMGTILWYSDQEVKLFKETLSKLKPHLKEINFKGDIDINCIINEEGVWPLEATPRFGSPSSEIHVELNQSPWCDFLSSVADGKTHDLKYSKEFGIGVSLTVPPFPYPPNIFNNISNKIFRKKILLNSELTKEEINCIHFEEIVKKDNNYFWSGTHGWVMHVTAKGKDIKEAQKNVYKIIRKINFRGMYYRKDIGDRVRKHDLPKLRAWGWV